MKIICYIFACFFYKLLPKFSDFINSADFTEKVTSKSIRLYPVFTKKKFEFNKIKDYKE